MYDLVSLGEPLLRLSPPKFERLRQTRRLDIFPAGAQLNVAANVAQLGWRAAFVTRLPDNDLGLMTRAMCAELGVDVAHIAMTPNSRMGMVYVEFTTTPRVAVSVYDRQVSAASSIAPGDFDWATILDGTRVAHTDGIFPGLSETCRAATLEFLQRARGAGGCLTSFDVNYREHLWTPAEARAAWVELLPLVDVLVTNRGVSEQVFGYSGTDDDLLRRYHDDFGCRAICLTTRGIDTVLSGAWHSRALADGVWVQGRRFAFEVVDRFGTGDAFFAGFLYGYTTRDAQYGLDFGNALCALAHTVEGDAARFSPAEVDAVLDPNYGLHIRR